MTAVQVQHYLSRARDFLKGMDLLKDDLTEFKCSSALLGIHGAISYCDALRVGLGSGKIPSEDHQSAVMDLKSLLASRKYERLQGADRLARLLSRRNSVAYAAGSITEERVKAIVEQAQRFAAWAEITGVVLKIEGWKYE